MVMIAGAGVLAIMFYAMRKADLVKKETSRLKLKTEERLIWDQVRGHLSARQSCLATFKSLDVGKINQIKTGNNTEVIEIENLKNIDATVAYKKSDELNQTVKIEKMSLGELNLPAGGSFLEKEKAYEETPAAWGTANTLVRKGTFLLETHNLKTDLNYKNRTEVKFVFKDDVLVDCYAVDKSEQTLAALIEQCKANQGEFNADLLECQYNNKRLFSSFDNNSAYCQMDKNRIKAQGYGTMSFCPDNSQWGGCIYKGKLLASNHSTVALNGKLPMAMPGPVTSKKVNFNEGNMVAGYIAGGVLGAVIGMWSSWCQKDEYHHCMVCNQGNLEIHPWYRRYQKKKKLKCRWYTTTYRPSCP